jgi:hypothetical protein
MDMDWVWASGIGLAALSLLALMAWAAVELFAEVGEERLDAADS